MRLGRAGGRAGGEAVMRGEGFGVEMDMADTLGTVSKAERVWLLQGTWPT